MAGKKQPKSELEEELIEGASLLSNFANELGEIIVLLNSNEQIDHDNDKLRSQANSLLLDALNACHARDVDGAQKNVLAATQRLNEQQALDYKDDKPRIDVRIRLTQLQTKALCDYETITKLIPKIRSRT